MNSRLSMKVVFKLSLGFYSLLFVDGSETLINSLSIMSVHLFFFYLVSIKIFKYVYSIDYSTIDNDQFICPISEDKTVHVWDFDSNKHIQLFKGHSDQVVCGILKHANCYINNIGVLSGNGYTISSGSFNQIIRIWDIEKSKRLNVFKGHNGYVRSEKYGSNEL
ncbi:WD-40 repeat protein, partial [Reticulomyxa filosa]